MKGKIISYIKHKLKATYPSFAFKRGTEESDSPLWKDPSVDTPKCPWRDWDSNSEAGSTEREQVREALIDLGVFVYLVSDDVRRDPMVTTTALDFFLLWLPIVLKDLPISREDFENSFRSYVNELREKFREQLEEYGSPKENAFYQEE